NQTQNRRPPKVCEYCSKAHKKEALSTVRRRKHVEILKLDEAPDEGSLSKRCGVSALTRPYRARLKQFARRATGALKRSPRTREAALRPQNNRSPFAVKT